MSVPSVAERIARIKESNRDLMHRMENMHATLKARREEIKSNVMAIEKKIDLNDAIIGVIKLREYMNNPNYC